MRMHSSQTGGHAAQVDLGTRIAGVANHNLAMKALPGCLAEQSSTRDTRFVTSRASARTHGHRRDTDTSVNYQFTGLAAQELSRAADDARPLRCSRNPTPVAARPVAAVWLLALHGGWRGLAVMLHRVYGFAALVSSWQAALWSGRWRTCLGLKRDKARTVSCPLACRSVGPQIIQKRVFIPAFECAHTRSRVRTNAA